MSSRRDQPLVQGRSEGFPQRAVPILSDFHEPFHGRRADASGGNVQDATQAHEIAGRGGGPEIGQHVLDFRTLVKGHATDHDVANPLPSQSFLEQPGLGVRSVQDADFCGRVVLQQSLDLPRYAPPFLVSVRYLVDDRTLAVRSLRP